MKKLLLAFVLAATASAALADDYVHSGPRLTWDQYLKIYIGLLPTSAGVQ